MPVEGGEHGGDSACWAIIKASVLNIQTRNFSPIHHFMLLSNSDAFKTEIMLILAGA